MKKKQEFEDPCVKLLNSNNLLSEGKKDKSKSIKKSINLKIFLLNINKHLKDKKGRNKY